MKKYIFLLLSVLFCIALSAAPRSLRQAQRMAPATKHCYTAMQADGHPAFYVFNRENEGGFVIISADDRAYTVLGYSDCGHWDEADLPDNMRAWLEGYVQELASVGEDYAPRVEQDSYTPVSPICQTKWGQRSPFNDLCPMYQGTHAAAGCVAIASAQIMKVYNYPTQGIGSNSYKWATENGDSIELSADFGATTYDWTNMLNSYDANATEAQKNAVATLVYHCGVADNMWYGKSSAANATSMLGKLINNFGYDKGISTWLKDYAGEKKLMHEIAASLTEGMPVYISAKTEDNTGHSFVCDGMDADGLIHINWGWFGKSDGYYRLSALAPQEQGTGGSSTNKAYTERIQIFTNIRPNINGEYVYSLTCEHVRVGKSAYHRDSLVYFYVDTLNNRGFCPWTGHLRLYVYHNGILFNTRSMDSMKALQNGKLRKLVTYAANFGKKEGDVYQYPDGEYEVVITARAEDMGDLYIPIYCRGVGEWKCQLTITGDSIYVKPIPAELNPTEGLEDVLYPETPQAEKILRDGVLYIRREGKTFTVNGEKVKD